MPNMDGPTMVRHVKALKPDLAVIFMSGYAEEAFRRNDQNSEDIHFLPKPFGLKQLAAKVKEVLSGAAGRRLNDLRRACSLQSARLRSMFAAHEKTPCPDRFCLLLAGCTDADWDHALNYGGLARRRGRTPMPRPGRSRAQRRRDRAAAPLPRRRSPPMPISAAPWRRRMPRAMASIRRRSSRSSRSYAQCVAIYTR